MTHKMQLCTRIGGLLLAVALAAPAPVVAQVTAVVHVDCDKQSIQKALERKADELIVRFKGICVEDIVIRRDRTTLQGVGAGATIIGSQQPEMPFGGGVTVAGATNVTLADFTVRNGRRGVAILEGGAARLERLTLRDNMREGLLVLDAAGAVVADSEMVGNGTYGAGVWDGSTLSVEPNASLILNENRRLGLVASSNSSVSAVTGSVVEAHDNHLYGIVSQLSGTYQLRGGLFSVQGNQYGLVVFFGGMLVGDIAVRNNGTAGVYVAFHSTLDLDGPVTDNGVFGIWAEEDAMVNYNGFEISGHNLAMFLDGTEAYVSNATVTDPVALLFGTRVNFAGGNDFSGGVSCDDTVLVRGDVSCPPTSSALASPTTTTEALPTAPAQPFVLAP